jgi:hypothetical protein
MFLSLEPHAGGTAKAASHFNWDREGACRHHTHIPTPTPTCTSKKLRGYTTTRPSTPVGAAFTLFPLGGWRKHTYVAMVATRAFWEADTTMSWQDVNWPTSGI